MRSSRRRDASHRPHAFSVTTRSCSTVATGPRSALSNEGATATTATGGGRQWAVVGMGAHPQLTILMRTHVGDTCGALGGWPAGRQARLRRVEGEAGETSSRQQPHVEP